MVSTFFSANEITALKVQLVCCPVIGWKKCRWSEFCRRLLLWKELKWPQLPIIVLHKKVCWIPVQRKFRASKTYINQSHNCTEVRFASLLSGGFTTMAVTNAPDWKLANRTFVNCLEFTCIVIGWNICTQLLVGSYKMKIYLTRFRSSTLLFQPITGQQTSWIIKAVISLVDRSVECKWLKFRRTVVRLYNVLLTNL